MNTTLLKLLLFFCSLVLTGSFAMAADRPDDSRWSLRYLARASNLLLVASDAVLENKANTCQIPADQLQKMTMNLKALIDSKLTNMTAAGKKRADEQTLTCEVECSCDIFSLLYEKNETIEHQKILSAINEKAAKMDSKSRQACASNFQEFCKSQLFQYLAK